MRRRRLAVAAGVAVVISALALVPAAPALACSCAPLEARHALAVADGAFVGALTSFEVLPAGQWAVYTFRVDESLKGGLPGEVEVGSAAYSAACGIEADPGDPVGLLLERRGNGWTSNLCTMVDPETLEKAARHQPAPLGPATSASERDGHTGRPGAEVSRGAVPDSGPLGSLWVLGASLFAALAAATAVRPLRRSSARG